MNNESETIKLNYDMIDSDGNDGDGNGGDGSSGDYLLHVDTTC